MPRIQFERSEEKAGFFSPLAGMQYAEQTIEVRRDPLTGMTAISSSELAAKEEMFYGKTDWDYTGELVRRSRAGCFFCPAKVMESTPRYPEEMLPGGRLQRGKALVFPNLFPLAGLHAVVTYPVHHFLRPSEFTAALLEDGLGAAVDFAGRAERSLAGLEHLELCCNHMLPAGASLVHPHFQVFGGPGVPWLVRQAWERSAAFRREHGVSFWGTLVEEETERGERVIETRAGVTWLTPFAPMGGREVLAVVPDAPRVSSLRDEQVAALARGLSKVLAWYEREALSAFNFTLYGGPLAGGEVGHPVVLRVLARTAFRADYRADDYFLQKQLGGELIFTPPEQLAAELRGDFAQG
jgi:UDPglucose--hexose-1-phosphate uridylyltransferase